MKAIAFSCKHLVDKSGMPACRVECKTIKNLDDFEKLCRKCKEVEIDLVSVNNVFSSYIKRKFRRV